MNARIETTQASPYLADTHELSNLSRELCDYNMFSQDAALMDAVRREGGQWAEGELSEFGRMTGSADYLELGHLANRFTPEFDSHDRFGKRIDLVSFHPAYHQLMKTSIEHGLHSSPWTDPRPGAHVARAAKSYLHSQVEAGHGCPITMTFAAVATTRSGPGLGAQSHRMRLRPAQCAGR